MKAVENVFIRFASGADIVNVKISEYNSFTFHFDFKTCHVYKWNWYIRIVFHWLEWKSMECMHWYSAL